ncbi:hypothetical protein PMAC_002222 [Pneumocystis sp. 'macacae']|nr:hypothetical protein PMAC_002222 [Pneumocystis sp. 'macacae']
MQPPTLIQTVLKYKIFATFLRPIAEGYVNLAGYRKIGLKYDDLIPEENDAMQIALKRLPKLEGYDRAYRLRVASQCSLAHTLLPEKQWVKAEEVTYAFENPILQEVVNEINERHDLDTLVLEKNPKH